MFTVVVSQLIKYLLEGVAIAFAAYVIPQKQISTNEIILIAVVAAAIFAILDYFTPFIGYSSRQGSGYGVGYNVARNIEGFENSQDDVQKLLNDCDNLSDVDENESVSSDDLNELLADSILKDEYNENA